MLMPSVFTKNLFDDVFDSDFYGRHPNANIMKTDVKESDQGYEISMDLPGVKKEDLKAELNDGYLTISATTNRNNDEKDSEGKYIRRERYSGTFSRSFYVGKNLAEEDIKAKLADGTLTLQLPKKDPAKQPEDKKYISIEG